MFTYTVPVGFAIISYTVHCINTQYYVYIHIGDDGVDIESLERALTLVKRRGEGLKTRPFSGDDIGESLYNLYGYIDVNVFLV
jgi:hypothetical protein